MKNHNLALGDFVKVIANARVSIFCIPPKNRFGKVIEIKKRYNPDNGRKLPDLITFRTSDGEHRNTKYSTIEKVNIK